MLDLTQVLAGPYCTMLLADLGADVVKIERPGGDLIRSNPPFVDDPDEEAYGGYFQSVNRGKRSIELDFGDETDREDFLSLVEEADVVVENYQAGTMEKYDLGYERLQKYNSELIYSSIRGFGDPRTGETDRQGQPSFDLIAQALGGVMEITGQEDGPPTKTGPGVGDLFTATLNCIGILAAVNHREQTGDGQYVDTGMYDSMISFTERAIYQQSYTGEPPSRQGNSHPTLFPYDAFETADGYVVIAAFNDRHWTELCSAMGRDELADDHSTMADRLESRHLLREEIADWTLDRTNDEVVDTLERRVPAAPVQTTADIFDDDHVRARDMLVQVEQPGTDEHVEIAGSPIKMTETSPEPRGRAPLLDEHRDEILGEEAETTADD
ncbi:L-carnitine dehydratase/bile acid-inducible protein F [Natronobacterium gregoryi SP2]|uniref:L-carnitine dehydratase/bile acid-inducible protein F n=1 Tax=Natronobacterium gregoryi (strain ATCC 43098 / DSM 3393 / CCM 3738 / CIP 104747 / IAM 13177 / JCM 8860 / NBRC 102187 / NCIMB 2189 / SP2) TaxID=797304 RepID=L9YFS6_NATGS|nr:L-carnitine dehydratase/bile acid-inducible protein F [Natronobacterium gregoryi SP2]